MPEITLSQGTIEYLDEGQGPPVVFVHGFLVDETLWEGTAAALRGEARCLRPTLPLGSHRLAMGPGFDASPRGVARLVLEFLDALGLEDVTLVGNDSGGAICQLLLDERPDRVSRVVFTNCDCFDKFPPFPFNAVFGAAKVPGLSAALVGSLRLAPGRRAGFMLLAERRLPSDLLARWCRPLTQDAAVRDETLRFLRAVDPHELLDVAPRLSRFEGRVVVAWGSGDRFFTPAYGRRLAALFGDAAYVEVADAKTFLPWDQPGALAGVIARELRGAGGAADATPGPSPRVSSPAAG